jgi:hypothetical protein
VLATPDQETLFIAQVEGAPLQSARTAEVTSADEGKDDEGKDDEGEDDEGGGGETALPTGVPRTPRNRRRWSPKRRRSPRTN